MRRLDYLGYVVGPVVPLLLAALPFWEEACYEFVVGVLEAELLVAGDRVGCRGLVTGMMLMCIVLSTLLILLSLLLCSIVGASSGKIWVLGLVPGSGLTWFLLLLFLVIKDPQTQPSQTLVDLIDAEFRKAWMPFCCMSGHLVVTVDQFLHFIGHLLPQEPQFGLPGITGRDLQEVAGAKKSTAGGLDGWAWNELKAHPLPWFSGLAILLELVETNGVWPQGLLDAFFAMIPKADGDSTPLGRRPLSVLPVLHWLWASLRLGHLRDWVEGWLLESVFSLGSGLSSVEAWFATALDIEEVLSSVGEGISCMSWLQMSLSLLTRWTGPFLTVPWGGLVFGAGSGRRTLLTIVRFAYGSSLLLV